jgi:hypothetical protein
MGSSAFLLSVILHSSLALTLQLRTAVKLPNP